MAGLLENTDQITYFWYLNVAKVDSMFSQVNGRLETERTEEKSKSLDGKVSTAIEVGGLLAKLGIGKVDVGGELSKAAGNVLSITSTLSPQNKVVVLMEYLQRASQLTVLRVDSLDEQATVARIAERPFQILHGKVRPDRRTAKPQDAAVVQPGAELAGRCHDRGACAARIDASGPDHLQRNE